MLDTLVVVDALEQVEGWGLEATVLPFQQYLEEHPKKNEGKIRLINLCDSQHYLSMGYYCSLLAEARGHFVLPTVNTINDLRSSQLYLSRLEELLPKRNGARTLREGEALELKLFFGEPDVAGYERFGKRIFNIFPAPMLQVTLSRRGEWRIDEVRRISLDELDAAARPRFREALSRFIEHTWRRGTTKKKNRWDLAILVDPKEKTPPSDTGALSRMIRAAAKVGIDAELIGANDYARLPEYDALFVRETTAIDHHTYRFARKAEIEGMVVIDDPTSILRCCNKVFLLDAFTYNRVPTLRTRPVFSAGEETLDALEREFGYPLVLKVPEGSFSRGVSKAEDRQQLRAKLEEWLATTSIVLAQEYLFTEFDWRIGVLNGRPLYACRYHMARGHWQIYHHGEKRTIAGGYDTLPTFEVPRPVLDAAVRASRIIGDGLYGVDLKQDGNKAYVIEVNDNPSIEHKVEDAYLGDELYMMLMSEFARRLENRGR